MSSVSDQVDALEDVNSCLFEAEELIQVCRRKTEAPGDLWVENDESLDVELEAERAEDFLEGLDYLHLVDHIREAQRLLKETEQSLVAIHRQKYELGGLYP